MLTLLRRYSVPLSQYKALLAKKERSFSVTTYTPIYTNFNFHNPERIINRLVAKNYNNYHLLGFYATIYSTKNRVSEFLNKGADPERIALLAALLGRRDILNLVIDKVTCYQTIAENAAIRGHKDIIMLCISKVTEVAEAGKHSEIDYCKILDKWAEFNHGLLELIDVFPCSSYQDVANWAACKNHYYVIDYLLKSNKLDKSLIAGWAAYEGNIDIMVKMFEQGADNYNLIALLAAYGGKKYIVQEMISKGANNLEELQLVDDIVNLRCVDV